LRHPPSSLRDRESPQEKKLSITCSKRRDPSPSNSTKPDATSDHSDSHGKVAPQRVLAPLHESCLILKDGESLLETVDLGFTAGFTLFV